MIQFNNKPIKPMIMALLAAAILTQAACTQAKTDTKPGQENSRMSEGMQVTYVDAKGAQALLLAKPETVVLDVRTPEEIEGGFIEGAVFANFYDKGFAEQLTKLDRHKPYIVHCRSGGRSTKALTTLEELGFKNVIHMDGGMNSWKHEKLPLTKS